MKITFIKKFKNTLWLSLIVLLISCKSHISVNPFTKGPYVQKLGKTEMTIVWETDSIYQGVVYYGLDENLGNSVKTDSISKLQKVTLKGLQPSKKYFYQVKVNNFRSEKYYFKTSVKNNSSFSFASYGDNKNGPFNHKKIANLILSYDPLFVSNNGDLVERGYVYKQWEKLFFTPAHELMANIPLVPAIGNHEENAEYYYNFFCIPNNKAWSSFDINGAHFIVVNTEEEFLFENNEQIEWLENDLKNNNANWTIIFQHVPLFTSGGNYYANSRIELKNLLHPLYEKYGVDFVITGHDHHYERSKPIGSKKSNNAVTYIVGGNGGTPMRYIGKPKNFSLVSSRTFGFAFIEIDASKLHFSEISIDNRIIDEFKIDKDNSESVTNYMKNKIDVEDIIDPVVASKLYSKGKKLYKKNKYEEAIVKLLESYKADKNCEEATAMLAQSYYQIKDFDNAEKFARITIKNAPLHPDSYSTLAQISLEKSDYEKAINWYYKQLQVEPETPDALVEIASIYEEQLKYDLTIKTYKDAINLLPNDWEIHFKLAEILEKTGQSAEALKEYKLAIEWFYDEKDEKDYFKAIKKIKELSVQNNKQATKAVLN